MLRCFWAGGDRGRVVGRPTSTTATADEWGWDVGRPTAEESRRVVDGGLPGTLQPSHNIIIFFRFNFFLFSFRKF